MTCEEPIGDVAGEMLKCGRVLPCSVHSTRPERFSALELVQTKDEINTLTAELTDLKDAIRRGGWLIVVREDGEQVLQPTRAAVTQREREECATFIRSWAMQLETAPGTKPPGVVREYLAKLADAVEKR